jgi:3-oxoacyl-[acyl-carrier protein] reductase
MNRLAGKRALITGAASGIGEAAVRRFREEGAQVFAVDRAAGEGVTQVDITAPGAPEEIAARAKAALGGLDILVNNAGLGTWAKFDDTTDELWDRMFAVNSRAPFQLVRACLPMLKESKAGRIINTGSVMSERTDKGLVAYTASKHAIAGMTRGLALEFGPLGITVNFVMPGAIATGMTRESFEDPKIRALWEKKSPLRRIAEPIEIAHGMLFLASDDASFITGTGLLIDGGLTLRT